MPFGPVSPGILSFLCDYSINPSNNPICTLFYNLFLVVVIGSWPGGFIFNTFAESLGLTERWSLSWLRIWRIIVIARRRVEYWLLVDSFLFSRKGHKFRFIIILAIQLSNMTLFLMNIIIILCCTSSIAFRLLWNAKPFSLSQSRAHHQLAYWIHLK